MPNFSIEPRIGTWELLARAWRRFRERDFIDLLARLGEEISYPTTTLGIVFSAPARVALAIMSWPRVMVVRLLAGRGVGRGMLYAFYDLQVEPVSFDFLWFLTGADLARQRAGLDHIHVVVVPGREDGFRKEAGDLAKFLER